MVKLISNMRTSSTLSVLFYPRVCWKVNSTSFGKGMLSKDNEEQNYKINANIPWQVSGQNTVLLLSSAGWVKIYSYNLEKHRKKKTTTG